MSAYSQTTPASPVQAKLEKVKADPKTKEHSAKADAHVVKQTTVIADTASVKQADPSPVKKKKAKKA